jgi:hypothetical protein
MSVKLIDGKPTKLQRGGGSAGFNISRLVGTRSRRMKTTTRTAMPFHRPARRLLVKLQPEDHVKHQATGRFP